MAGEFDLLKQAELQAECRKRDLPASGSNAEMIARLEEYQVAQELLGGDDETAAPAPDDPAEPPAPVAPPAPLVDPAEPHLHGGASDPVAPREFRTSFPCPGHLSTETHLDYRRATVDQAFAAGLVPRGLSSARRTGWVVVDGVRHAVYAVFLRR